MKRPRSARTAKDIAERLREEFGADAVAVVALRVEEARRAGDPDEVGLLNEAASLLMSGADDVPEDSSPLWWFLQRIEFYRHQASNAEASAAATESNHRRRQEMSDLAMRWRELALHADLLARRTESAYRTGAPPRHGRARRESKPGGD